MSKKKFLDGIDDIFSGALTEHQDSHDFVENTSNSSGSPTARRSTHHKTFVTNLDSLLAEITEDPFFSDHQPETVSRPGKSKSTQSGGYRAPVTGLDALIRQTLTPFEGEDEETTKKRISVIVDKIKLERLKTIARMEGSFMKDIIADLIETYVQGYAKEKGVDL